MATCTPFLYHRFLFQFFFLFFSLLCSSRNGTYAQHPTELGQHFDSHIVSVASLLPSTVCNRTSPKVLSGKASLEVVSRHGPCSNLKQGKGIPPFSQVLLQDRIRVKSIHSKMRNDRLKDEKALTVPAKSGTLLGAGNYFVTVGIGTPKQFVTLTLDTGSDVTWTQCKQCSPCYNQVGPLYDPSKSKSYSNISCGTSLCNLISSSGHLQGCVSKQCVYDISYGDSSSSLGFFAKEKLTLTSSVGGTTSTISGYLFGCGLNNVDEIGMIAGIMGLGRTPLSIISQTSAVYKQYFSLCLPATYSSSTGYIAFGKTDLYTNKLVKFTPITTTPEQSLYYDVGITGLSVAGQKLSIPSSVFTKAGAIIDSGTVVSRLPPAAYVALRSAFRRKMTQYKMIKYPDFDTCYDFNMYDTVVVPKISIFFKNGVELELDTGAILNVMDSNKPNEVCLAFLGNEKEDDQAIIGNMQYQGMEVHYDVAGRRVGFGPRAC